MQDFARRVFRLGPATLTLVMAAASAAYYPWQHYGSWMTYAIILGAFVTALWHLFLILIEREKIKYFLYALVNIPLYVVIGLYCLMIVTGDSL
jgi:hypothetical protein